MKTPSIVSMRIWSYKLILVAKDKEPELKMNFLFTKKHKQVGTVKTDYDNG
jgi:hypothetical protein